MRKPGETDRESRLGGLVLMGVSSSELLSSSSDSSDWISSTMERRGPGRAQEVKSHQSRHKPTEGEREPTLARFLPGLKVGI